MIRVPGTFPRNTSLIDLEERSAFRGYVPRGTRNTPKNTTQHYSMQLSTTRWKSSVPEEHPRNTVHSTPFPRNAEHPQRAERKTP